MSAAGPAGTAAPAGAAGAAGTGAPAGGARVAVIIPVRDRRALLGAALDALEAQTYRDFRVVVVDDGADLVYGTTRPARPLAPLERSVGSGEEGLFPTCNVVYRRAAFEAAGGFGDARGRLGFRPHARARGLGFGEDTLLGWRVKRSGADVRHVPEALVVHHVFPPDLGDWVSRCAMAAAFPALVGAVPELRATLVRRGVLFGARSRLPCYATLAAVARRRNRRPALAGAALAWWALTRLAELRRQPATWPRRLVALPQEMVLDAVTGVALVLGSARARVLLL